MADEFRKPPGDKLDYQIDWDDWLSLISDTINASTWTADPTTGITISGPPAPSFTPVSAKVWISGGTLNQNYTIYNTITTVGGRIRTRYITLFIRDKS
ncbi:hypothetical protein [Nocardia sp. NPDC057440]|uniref:phage fiber-tail adaptor protein n=1 Tax=Nocardia sp. NPDC057440 TaxID=3346134 RepID=UPI00366A9EC2